MIALAILVTVILIGAVVAGIFTGWRENDILQGIGTGLITLLSASILAGAAIGVWALWTEALS